jgi:MoaA/NifB/PqqE/SkfB family radical SAM enzyme
MLATEHLNMVGQESSAAGSLFVLIPQPFGSLVFERSTCRYLPFDVEATQLLQALAQENIDSLMEWTKDRSRRIQVARFYEEFYALGFFTLDGCFVGEILNVKPPANHLTGPLAVHLEISDSCNLRCCHCFAGDLDRQESPLGSSELERLFAQMSAMGSYRLGLTGGEPLLREDLFEVIDLALKHGLSPCVTTNGMLIEEATAREFGRRGLLWLNVSLEGASPATNDLVRGRGSFERVIKNLRILSKYSKFSLAFTVMRTNLHEIGRCVELAQSLGAESVVFRPLYPVGTARKHLELMPTFAEYNAALEGLRRTRPRNTEDACGVIPFSPAIREPAGALIYWNHGCGAGNLVCSISHSGNLSPCSFLGTDFQVGNIREHSLSELWREAALERFRKGPAKRAPGCRARALWLNGSVDAADPWFDEEIPVTMLQKGDYLL